MEPPIGYGSTHRSIFPESQFGTTAAPCFRGRSREVQTGSMPLLVRVEIAEGVYGIRDADPMPDRDGPAQDGLVRDP
jgi:hypothetical protein